MACKNGRITLHTQSSLFISFFLSFLHLLQEPSLTTLVVMHKVIDAEEEGGGNFHPLHLPVSDFVPLLTSAEKRYKEFLIINEEKKREFHS
jgi:hypothetical protein